MNHAVIMGRLTRDPETRSTTNGKNVTRYTLAVDGYGQNAEADFIPCVAWDKLSDFAAKYFKQGMRVLVSGRIKTGHYTDREGRRVNTTELILSSQEFADSKGQTAPAPTQGTAQAAGDAFLPVDPVDDAGVPWNS